MFRKVFRVLFYNWDSKIASHEKVTMPGSSPCVKDFVFNFNDMDLGMVSKCREDLPLQPNKAGFLRKKN